MTCARLPTRPLFVGPSKPHPVVRVYRGRGGATDEAEWRELRAKALRLLDEGWTVSEVGAELSVSSDTISQWKHRFRPHLRRASPHQGPCKEWGCVAAGLTRHGYCGRHAELRVYRKHPPRKKRKAPVPCANAPVCERKTGRAGGKGLCPPCYRRQLRAAHREAARQAEEVGL